MPQAMAVESIPGREPPPPESLSALRPRDGAGVMALGLALTMTAVAFALAAAGNWWLWAASQVLLAIAFLQWFVLLHEAGHKTLFRTQPLNRLVGHLASVFAIIPFHSWRRIHARHHKFTGWQDLDATTALLVPRTLRRLERMAMNAAWASWLPLFSIIYRIQNFWNLQRLRHYLAAEEIPRGLLNVTLLAAFYLALVVVLGPVQLLRLAGLGLFLTLMAQDIILLGQHTHMPHHISDRGEVEPFKPLQQERFTRSLILPKPLSWLLLRFDLHELHHMYVHVPGYDLHHIGYRPRNEVDWLDWLNEAKKLTGEQFLFGDREHTGLMR